MIHLILRFVAMVSLINLALLLYFVTRYLFESWAWPLSGAAVPPIRETAMSSPKVIPIRPRSIC